MIKGKDIIVISIQPWDIEIGSNCKNIAAEFSKNNRVLYVNPPLDRFTSIKERQTEKIKKRLEVKNGRAPALVEIHSRLWNLYPIRMVESINRIPHQGLFHFLNKKNSQKFARDIRHAIEKLNFSDFYIFNDSSMFLGLHLKELLKPQLYIYYMRDYLVKNPYWKKHGERLEPELIKKADLVVNNSVLYQEYGKQYNSHSYMVGQGCDTTLFNNEVRKKEVPREFDRIPRPVIGYVGNLTSRRLDMEIIQYLATSRKNWSFVLVGPEDENFRNSPLHKMDNVFFLGSRDTASLPHYIEGFDIAMNPQLINDATMGNYPRKIDEYLAMGKPVLASATKAMEYFKDYAYVGSKKEDFLQLAESALQEDNESLQKKRRAFALSHSWENNVNEIYKYMHLVAREKNIPIK